LPNCWSLHRNTTWFEFFHISNLFSKYQKEITIFKFKGFKGGGLLKLLRNFHTSAMQIDHVLPAREAVQTACQTLRHIQGAVKLLLGAGAIQQDFSAILKIVESLIKRVRSLTILLDAPFVGKIFLMAINILHIDRPHRICVAH
jgi:hypothetical protein